jgi:bile acid:Na+ symporter, BASS family
MSPLLVVIVTFGLIFVVTATLGQGFSVTRESISAPLRAHSQLNVMLLLSTFVVLPAALIGLGAILPFAHQVKMAIVVLALCGGAPFVPWLVSLAKGNIAYSGAATVMLLVATFVVLPLTVPPLERALDTGAHVSVWRVAWPMLLFMLLPFLVGVLIRNRYPSLMMAIAPWLGPLSITFLVVHITLFIGYSWSQFLSIAGYGQMAFTLAFPLLGMLIGYLLSPPYILSPVKPADSHRGSKIVSAVAVAQQNTGAVICCAIFAFGKYVVAGDYMLLGAILTIIVVTAAMAELGARFEKQQGLAPAAPQSTTVRTTAPAPQAAAAASARAATPEPALAGVASTPSQGVPQVPQGDH